MTVHRLSAGDGYAYYIRETVTADERRERGRELGDYYTAKGQPPGLWMGSGIGLLGVSGTVTEAQMRSLFGQGLHPEAERIIAERIAEGFTPKKAVAAAKLGRAFPKYKGPDSEFTRRLDEATEAFKRMNRRAPGAKERADLRGKVGAQIFRQQHGRGPESKEELGRFIKRAEGGAQKEAVAGFDLVFSAPKSVSVLWALGSEEVRRAVEQAHEQAVADTLAWLEAEAVMTRTGFGGIAQEHVQGGLIATRFRHYDNRLGEPLLHDHVVVANKVLGPDGKWRSLDSALLYAMNVPASELYNARVVEAVCTELGLRAEAREVTAGKRPVMEIAGVGGDLIEGHSQRSQGIKERVAELVEQFRQEHGREPSSKVLLQLMQQATLDTRPDKEKARSLSELRVEWRAAAVDAYGADRVNGLLRAAQAVADGFREDTAAFRIDMETAAREVIETVSEHRSVWGRRQVLAEARRWVMNATRGTRPGADIAEQIAALALVTEAINITPPDANPRFPELTRPDGTSIYRRRETELFTSCAVLAAEERVVAAARTLVIPSVSAEVYERVEAAYQLAHPDRPLDAGQRALARAFATGEHLVEAAIGPAGAGKTTAMAVAGDAVRAAGGRVVGLGPSARAAAELSAGTDAPAYVLHEWLARREGAHDGAPIEPGFELFPGDLIIVDEAGMAGTKRLAAVIADAQQAGAVVRLVGDPGQLASVESGGALRLLAGTVDVVELESVHRFRAEGEAAASLALRGGEVEDAWTWYLDEGRIIAGTREQMIRQIFADWQTDIDAGLTAMMMADDNATVSELNAMAQAHRLATGRLDLAHSVGLRDGLQAHRGDLVVTRKNARKNVVRGGKDFVKNGDQWSVVRVADDGTMVVRHTGHGGQATLPADYVQKHLELGYASTAHRGQGATVDTGSGLFSTRTAREAAYVEMTRGRQKNRGYVILEDGQTMADVLESIVRNAQASRSATDTIREEWDRAWGIRQLANEYTDVHARALSLRYQSMLRNLLGEDAEGFIAADAWPAVVRAVRDAEAAGFAPERILSAAYHERDFHDADDVSAVLSWRIDNHVENARGTVEKLAGEQTSRPLADLTTEQLDALEARATERRTQALENLNRADARVANRPRGVVVDGQPVPAWPHRAYGDRTRTQLAAEIARVRYLGRSADRAGDDNGAREAYAALASMRREQRIRARMAPLDRMRETWQREPGTGHAATAGLEGVVVSAMMRANVQGQEEARVRLEQAEVVIERVRAEQRIRRILPDNPAPVPDHSGPVPEWLAPREVERDQHTPEAWVEHLQQRRAVIEDRLRQTGHVLAEDPPAWTRILGPVPPVDHELREAWELDAALADAWRTRRQVRDSEPGIGVRPEAEADAQAWQALHDQVSRIGRRARAVEAAAQRAETLYPTAIQETAETSVESDPAALAVAEETPVVEAEPHEELTAEDVGMVAVDPVLPAVEQAPEERPDEPRAEREAEVSVADPQQDLAAEEPDPVLDAARATDEPDARRGAPEVSEDGWQDLPYAMLSDAELATTLAYAVDAAETAQEQTTAQDARVTELAEALARGGEVEQRVAARAERVEAIQQMRAAADRVRELTAGVEFDAHQVADVEAKLAETGRFGRPAVRSPEREQMERQLLDLRAAAAQREQQLSTARQRLADSTHRAGPERDHDELLANWERAGGSRETVLARTKASRSRSLQSARVEAEEARSRVTTLDASAASIRQEMQRRDAQPYAQRVAEETRRLQAAQRTAEQQRQQNQQQGPDQNRGGRSRGGPEL
ncbi:MobF family relaxase [Kitasatospora sp. NPDC087861]|uniref:MobF family relaxase n=1 Tax=unclassified Kitasatospora TaxID=2633591 RepID=UPI002475B87F|nr:MobF family relaxase [Kitasatospora sp. MAA19]